MVLFDFPAADVKCHVAAENCLPILHQNAIFIPIFLWIIVSTLLPLKIRVSLKLMLICVCSPVNYIAVI